MDRRLERKKSAQVDDQADRSFWKDTRPSRLLVSLSPELELQARPNFRFPGPFICGIDILLG
jgi:hypothetical protein